MKKLVVQGRYLAWEDGEPFFYLGDTAWEIFHRLSREDAEWYLSCRAEQGFTVIQGVALAEFEGVTTPNYYGRLPLLFTDGIPDPEKPDITPGYSYWDHVDFIIQKAQQYGLFVALLPTWGDKFHLCWGKGPEIFSVENAYTYGRWIASRYRDMPNIIWMLGGDRPLETVHKQIVLSMAEGIRSVDTDHLITFHPCGCRNSTEFVLENPYIDFHTAQTGHGIEQCYESDEVIKKMASITPKPVMDSESRYEDHPACFNDRIGYFWNADDVRQNAYWNVLAGACGQTYGNHSVWSMNAVASSYYPYSWKEALTHPGAQQMKHLKKLRLSRDYFSLVPQENLICGNFEGMGHMTAAAGNGYVYVYSPLGIPFTVDLECFKKSKPIRASWFNPRTGEEQVFAILPCRGKTTLVPPSQGKGMDWVLILEETE
ncbi:MAG: glycoside hydrolase family 140 protein [Massiliimalia sp.]|jgi:hypothetical protein